MVKFVKTLVVTWFWFYSTIRWQQRMAVNGCASLTCLSPLFRVSLKAQPESSARRVVTIMVGQGYGVCFWRCMMPDAGCVDLCLKAQPAAEGLAQCHAAIQPYLPIIALH